MPATIRRRMIYRGRVQGVGFRATVRSLASNFDVTGYVRNLPDGTVELVAHGSVAAVEGLLAAIGDRMSRYIVDTDVSEPREDESFSNFKIR